MTKQNQLLFKAQMTIQKLHRALIAKDCSNKYLDNRAISNINEISAFLCTANTGEFPNAEHRQDSYTGSGSNLPAGFKELELEIE